MSRSKITPHASHRMGKLEGEDRCLDCWAAPDWPIIEDACLRTGGTCNDGRARDQESHMALSEVEHAIHLHDVERMIWEDVAALLGRRSSTIRQAVSRLQRGVGRLAMEKARRDAGKNTQEAA